MKKGACANGSFSSCGQFVDNLFDFGQLKRPTGSVTSATKPPKNVEKLNLVRRMVQFLAALIH
jgi:hypothetical protein